MPSPWQLKEISKTTNRRFHIHFKTNPNCHLKEHIVGPFLTVIYLNTFQDNMNLNSAHFKTIMNSTCDQCISWPYCSMSSTVLFHICNLHVYTAIMFTCIVKSGIILPLVRPMYCVSFMLYLCIQFACKYVECKLFSQEGGCTTAVPHKI